MINVKITFPNAMLRINQLSLSSASQVLEKRIGELLSEGELIF